MTIGIYALIFEGTDKVYIGQSIHIEVRFKEHISSIYNGHISDKLAEAIKLYGEPKLEILQQCNIVELDILEELYIEEFDSVNNGFNIMYRPFTNFHGDKHPNSVYENSIIEKVFELLIQEPCLAYREISNLTSVSIAVIENIAACKSHSWLKGKYPLKYLKLEQLKGTRKGYGNTAKGRGIIYPIIVSPSGKEYIVEHLVDFAKKHCLTPTRLSMVLHGKSKIHRGWVIKENILLTSPQ
jgi:hypothetical protein